jgi:hypothetical protein
MNDKRPKKELTKAQKEVKKRTRLKKLAKASEERRKEYASKTLPEGQCTWNDVRGWLAEAKPEQAAAASGGSRRASIRLFCLECMGGHYVAVRNCRSYDCFLWQFRMGTRDDTVELLKSIDEWPIPKNSTPKLMVHDLKRRLRKEGEHIPEELTLRDLIEKCYESDS